MLKKRGALLFIIICILGVCMIPKRKRILFVSNFLLQRVDYEDIDVNYKFNREEINGKKTHTEDTLNFISRESLKDKDFLRKLFNDIPDDFFEKRINEEGYFISSLGKLYIDKNMPKGELEYILVYNKKMLKDFVSRENFNVIDMLLIRVDKINEKVFENEENIDKKFIIKTKLQICENFRMIYSCKENSLEIYDLPEKNKLGIIGVKGEIELLKEKNSLELIENEIYKNNKSTKDLFSYKEIDIEQEGISNPNKEKKSFYLNLLIKAEGDSLDSKSIIHYDNDERKRDYDLTYKIKIGY